jgi:hypothetical protein
MLQRSEMGRKFRQHFIAVEEAWNSPEKVMERAFQIAHQRAVEAERRILSLTDTCESLEIALNTSLQFFTVAKYNKILPQELGYQSMPDHRETAVGILPLPCNRDKGMRNE